MPTRSEASAKSTATQTRRPRGLPSDSHISKLERIKEVAAQYFYAEGYAATDLRRIADALDMHVSTLYNYISGKESLLYLIMQDGMTEISEGLQAALATADDPASQLRAALRSHVLHHAHRRYLAWTSHIELRSLTGEYLADINKRRSDYERVWMRLLKKGMSSGVFAKSDPKVTLYGLLSAGQTVSRWYQPGGRLDAEQIADILADNALAGVLVR